VLRYKPIETPKMETPIFKFEMYAKVTETVTGLKGTITARCESIGQIQYQVEADATSSNVVRSEWFSEPRLMLTPSAE